MPKRPEAASAAGGMVTLPQPGQTLPLGTTSLVSPKSWSTLCLMRPMVAVCAALSVACWSPPPGLTKPLSVKRSVHQPPSAATRASSAATADRRASSSVTVMSSYERDVTEGSCFSVTVTV